jgi:hypothetical protein
MVQDLGGTQSPQQQQDDDMTNKHNASRNDFIFPINQWFDLCSLRSEQLDSYAVEKYKHGFSMETRWGFRHGCEVLEAKISGPNNA